MPVHSLYPSVEIPNVDLWSLMFERAKPFADTQVVYRSADNPTRHYAIQDVRTAATIFGEGLYHHFDWQTGDVLAMYSPNDVDFAPVIFGTQYAGGTVSPVNPTYTPTELAFQLRDSGAKVLVTTNSLLPKAIKAAESVGLPLSSILLMGSEKSEAFRHWSDVQPSNPQTARGRQELKPDEHLAFLVYSSGTTGLPKGVMLTHRNIVAQLSLLTGAMGRWYDSGKDKVLGILPFFHIYGLVALVCQSLFRGIEIVVVGGYEFRQFLDLIQTHKITLVYVAPPVVVRLAHDPLAEKFDLSSLRMLTSGAAPLPTELIEKVHKKLGIAINQAYGLSETSPMTHTQPWDEWQTSIGSVGKMFPNLSGKFMSEDQEVKRGEVGEFWVAGPIVFKGYWKNEEATAAAIAEQDGKRYFRTGDVGYEDEHGSFFITDRVKDLIKFKGFQVAPTELEGKLVNHPLVQDAAVIGVYDTSIHSEVPRAYIVHAKRGGTGCDPATGAPEDEHSIRDAEEIKSWFDKQVAGHKRLRGGIRFLNEIPKSASGKILKKDIKDLARREEVRQGAKL